MSKQKTITLLSSPNPSLAEAIELWAEINPSHRIKNLETLKAKLQHHYKITPSEIQSYKRDTSPLDTNTPQTVKKGHALSQSNTPQTTEKGYTLSQYQNHPIELIVKKHTQLNATRSQLDIQRKALGIGNDEPTVKKRKALTKSINEMSNLIELLYITKENYYEKNIPIPETVIQLIDDYETPSTSDATHPQTMATEAKLDNLQKELNSLLVSQRRDNYQLEFQSTKKQAKPNPMPKNPKRFAIEKRIQERTEKINIIRNQIKSLKATP